MLRSRGPEMLQRSSSPRAPLRDKTNTCSVSKGLHRSISCKPENALRTTRISSPFYEKKRGSKMAELEKKLNKAREEVKLLRDQLALAEAAKQATDKTSDHILSSAPIQELKESQETAESTADQPVVKENDDESDQKQESTVLELKDAEDTSSVISKNETEEAIECQETEQQLIPESSEVVELKAKLLVKEEEIEFLLQQNMIFKAKAEEQADCIAAAAKTKEEELIAKLSSMEEELKASKGKEEQLREQIEVAEAAKAEADAEMRRMKVQSEQWRKAAEAAAAVVAAGNGKGIGRCRKSMDVNLDAGGYGEWRMSSAMAGEFEDGVVDGGRRKGAGIRIFGDLLKKKGQHK